MLADGQDGLERPVVLLKKCRVRQHGGFQRIGSYSPVRNFVEIVSFDGLVEISSFESFATETLLQPARDIQLGIPYSYCLRKDSKLVEGKMPKKASKGGQA